MSWKKHFVTYQGQQSPISGKKKPTDSGNTSKFSSWLPEIYTGADNRIERYTQYDQMDNDSEVNTALDTISEFATQTDETTSLPFTVEWTDTPTDSETEILDAVLTQWCNINEWDRRLFATFRNTIKYGDQAFIRDPETWKLNFVAPNDILKVIVDEANGKEPSQYVIKNIDPNFQTLTATSPSGAESYFTSGVVSPASFNGLTGGQSGVSNGGNRNGMQADMEFLVDANHVIHLAMTAGMDANWPFGNSILDPIYKTFKQKELLEDSIIIYRIARAPERRIFNIDTGDMAPHLAMAFVERFKNEIHQRRIPTKTGGGSSMMDAQYNPLSALEDYFFPKSSDGRGSDVTTLPGGSNLGDIDDLKFMSNKMVRALRVPSSYMPTSLEDGTATYNDGRVGTAYIQEFRFSQYVERLQKILKPSFNNEFKLFLKNRGYTIDSSTFNIGFVEPQNFSQYREIDLDGARASLFGQLDGVDYLSKQFVLKKYLGLTDAEILENEKLMQKENPPKDGPSDDQNMDEFSSLGQVGASGGMSGDLDDFADLDADMDGDVDMDDFDGDGGSAIPGDTAGAEGEVDEIK
jgi:hypothetical protein